MSETLTEALERLHFHLDNQSGFWFALVATDAEAPRVRMREAGEAWCKEHGVAFYQHEPEPTGLVPLGIDLARGDQPGLHWIRADGVKGTAAEWEKHATLLFMAMNERRDGYRKRLEGAIIVEGRASLKLRLRDLAPDLFSIRAFIAEPSEESDVDRFEAPESQRKVPTFDDAASDLVDPDALGQHISRLEGAGDRASIERRIFLRGELVRALLRAERFEAAKRAADVLDADVRAAGALPTPLSLDAQYLYNDASRAAARSQGDFQAALVFANNAIIVVEQYPEHRFTRDRSAPYAARARIRELLSDREGGISDWIRAIEYDELELQADPRNPRLRGLLLDHGRNVSLQFTLAGRSAEALEVLGRAQMQLASWEQENPNEIRWLYERACLEMMIGAAQSGNGDLGAALRMFKRAAATAEACRKRDPGDRHIRRAVLGGHILHATIYLLQRDVSPEGLDAYDRLLGACTIDYRNRESSSAFDLWAHANLELLHGVLLSFRRERQRALESFIFAAKRSAQLTRTLARYAGWRATMRALDVVVRVLAAPDAGKSSGPQAKG
ncbi:MAG: hypothetical protein IPM54_33770 [Polyangiaceae bacterium]|nr:hypothetical protein [Polyangiaceae bacterium]